LNRVINQLFNSNNEFFLLAQNSKRLTHIALSSFILPVIFLILAGVLTQFIFAPLTIGEAGDTVPWIREAFGLFTLFAIIIIIVFLWVRFYEGRKISSLGFTKSNWILNYLTGFGLGILMVSVVVGIIALFGNVRVVYDSPNLTGIDSLGIVLIFLVGYLIQGASEEILSRGWMMQVIGARYRPWVGVIISSLLFAIFHLNNSGVTVLSVINLIIVALFLALFVMKDENLWSACGWHSSWNWMLGNVYGLSVSGTGEKVSVLILTHMATLLSQEEDLALREA
jgi:membrane protease YdiL (CAAX protease family)